jgi:hypothetical protein
MSITFKSTRTLRPNPNPEQSSYSAILNIAESVPPQELIPSISGILELSETGIGRNSYEFRLIPGIPFGNLMQ